MADSTKSRAVVLLSGGMDSAVCAALAVRDYSAAAAVHISYGQRNEERERQSFLAICRRLNILDQLMVRNDALSAIGGSALTDEGIAVPDSDAAGPGLPGQGLPGGGISALGNKTVRVILIAVRLTTRHSTRWCARGRKKDALRLSLH